MNAPVLDDAPYDALTLAQKLIGFASVTPDKTGALDFLNALLQNAKFKTHRLRFGEGAHAVDNLYARFGTAEPCLLLAGHSDVVPVGDEEAWTHPPFAGVIDNGQLYGRGACDMKGGLAGLLAAGLNFCKQTPNFQGSLAFLITGDEEGAAVHGTKDVLAWCEERGERFSHCLLAEPTSVVALGDTIKIGRRGSLSGHLTVRGKQGHVAYPHLANNPTALMLKLIEALTSIPLDKGTQWFDPSNFEIVSIDTGNTAYNVIPGKIELRFNVRFNDLWTDASLADEISARLNKALQSYERAHHKHDDTLNDTPHHHPYELVFLPSNAPAFRNPPDYFAKILQEAIAYHTPQQAKLSTSGGTSDARFIQAYCPVLEFGPVGTSMHGIDEHISVRDLAAFTKIVEELLQRYFQDQ